MLNKYKSLALATIFSTTITASFCATAETTLRYSNWLPEGYPVRIDILEPWMRDIERVTEGRVKIETTPSVVGSVAGQFDVIAYGQADIALIVPGYTPGRFPLTEVFELPFLGDVAEARSPATYDIYKEHLEQYNDFKGVKVMSVFTGSSAQIVTSNHSIKDTGDLKGLKLRSPQPATSQALELLGAEPVAKPVPEIYELASGGIIDGGIIVPETVVGFNLYDALKSMTLVPGGMANTTLMVAMNQRKWDRLSAEDQQAIEQVSGEALALLAGQVHDQSNSNALTVMRESQANINHLPQDAVDKMKRILEPVETAWLQKARDRGVENPEEILEALKKAIAERESKVSR